MLKIRLARRADARAICMLLNSAKEVKVSPSDVQTIAQIDLAIRTKNRFVLMAEDNRLAGVLIADIYTPERWAYIVYFVVSKSARGKGVGSALYAAFEALCKKKRPLRIMFLVNVKNKAMQEWSRQKGFKRGYNFAYFEKKLR